MMMHDPATCRCDHCRVEQAMMEECARIFVPTPDEKIARRHWGWCVFNAIVLGWVVVLLWLAFGG